MVASLFRGELDLLEEFEGFLIDSDSGFISSEIVSCDDQDGLRSLFKQASDFIENIRARLDNPDECLAFFDSLSSCRARKFDSNEFRRVVTDWIGNFPELMDEFEEFLQRFNNIGRPLFANIHVKSWAASTSKCKKSPQCDFYQRPTPSYRLRNKKCSKGVERSQLEAEVLNDKWVCVPVSSNFNEDKSSNSSYGGMDRSEDTAEDLRYEKDMYLSSLRSTEEQAETYELVNLQNPIKIRNHFSASNLRCIENLYGDHGLQMIEVLEETPSRALPVILRRLRQKQDEFLQYFS
ncbi:Paired amphipathic helix protein Sin3-like [Quillaja saponaria]|uniref:Paired amphipathic helix protein Sin3-like n=1 Tax=Quillaja saponaria TaxID=32244 RepID=A0AAD7QDE1_QUISA|nr:Paired amphipathic helix protein Sin3-like [Quillaja saponaria]